MTEKSWLWDGTSTGDASLAPYAKEAFNRWFATARSNDSTTNVYAIPGFLDDLLIEATDQDTVSTLTVKSGAAIIDNFIYTLSEEKHFPILQLSTSLYRYDSLILRLTRDDVPKVRMFLVQGNENSSFPPTPYTLVQEENGTWEIEIARVLIDSSVYQLDPIKVEVWLTYLPLPPHTDPDPYNVIMNPEWLAISGETALGTGIEEWNLQAAPSIARASALGNQGRGSALNISHTAADIMRKMNQIDGRFVDRVTIQGALKQNDSTTRVKIRLLYLKDFFTYSDEKQEDTIGFNTEDTHYFTRTFAYPSDARYMWVYVTTAAATNDFDIGQITVSPGFYTGSRRPFHQYIGLKESHTDNNWNGDAKSSATTTINLGVDFSAAVPQHVKGVVLLVRARDSGSAGGNAEVRILSYTSAWQYGSLYLDGVTNNYWRSTQIVAYINEPFQQSLSTNRGLRIQTVATGAGTLDVYVEIVGYIV